MKSKIFLVIFVVSLLFTACQKTESKNDAVEPEASKESVEIEETPAYENIPAVIITPDAWAAVESDDEEDVLVWSERFVQFDKVTYLGIKKDRTYKNSNGKTGNGSFYLCEVEKDGEKKQLWFYHTRVRPNSEPGVVVEKGFLFEEDDIVSILSQKVEVTDLLVYDTEYFDDTFIKVRIPSISESKDYFLEKKIVSTKPIDLKVIQILDKASAFEEGKEEVQLKLLHSASEQFSNSSLINLVYDKIEEIELSLKEQENANNEEGEQEELEQEEVEPVE